MIDRDIWLSRIVELLRDFSDAEYQERVWVSGRGPECSSWREHLCMFFDDADIENFLGNYAASFGVTDVQQKALATFYSGLDSYSTKRGSDADAREILADPEWTRIRELAHDTLELFSEYERRQGRQRRGHSTS